MIKITGVSSDGYNLFFFSLFGILRKQTNDSRIKNDNYKIKYG